MAFYEGFLYFFLYSIIGWLCEVIYCSIPARHFINRGFLHGPYCPIYGFGALIVIYLLLPFQGHFWLIFLLGMISTTILEYITHYGMEKLFHATWWDYSDRKWNINGRVCFLNSVLFGLLSLALMYLIHPFVADILGHIPGRAMPFLATACMILLAVDITSSCHAAYDLKHRLENLKRLSQEQKQELAEKWEEKWQQQKAKQQILHQQYQEQKQELQEKIQQQKAKQQAIRQYRKALLEQQKQELAAKNSFAARRLLNAFPAMHSEEFDAQLANIRAAIAERKQNRKLQKQAKKKQKPSKKTK